MHNFKVYKTFGQVVVLVDGQSDGDCLRVFPRHFVLNYRLALGAAAVFGGGGGREMPFYEGGTGYEGDIVEVNYLDVLGPISSATEGQQIRTRSVSSNFGYKCISLCIYTCRHIADVHTLRALDTTRCVHMISCLFATKIRDTENVLT